MYWSYRVDYVNDSRIVEIYFDSIPPFQIQGWKEIYADGNGINSKMLITSAIKTGSEWINTWEFDAYANKPVEKLLAPVRPIQ